MAGHSGQFLKSCLRAKGTESFPLACRDKAIAFHIVYGRRWTVTGTVAFSMASPCKHVDTTFLWMIHYCEEQ